MSNYDIIFKYLRDNNIAFMERYPAIDYELYFYKKIDAINLLKYLYKNARKLYFKINSVIYINGVKHNSFYCKIYEIERDYKYNQFYNLFKISISYDNLQKQ